MYRQTISPVVNRNLANGLIASLTARPAAAQLDAFIVMLITAGPGVFTPTDVFADYTEATFGGYTAVDLLVQVTANAPINTPSGNQRAIIGSTVFSADSSIVAPGQVVIGYIVVNAAMNAMFMAEQFIDPVPFAIDGDFLALDILMPVGEVFNIT